MAGCRGSSRQSLKVPQHFYNCKFVKHSTFAWTVWDAAQWYSLHFCWQVESLQIINCRYHPWCAPIVSQKGLFFETYLLGQGRHNKTFGYWSWKGMEGWNIWQLQAIGLTASSVPYIFMLRIRRFSGLWWKFDVLGFLELFVNLLIVCTRPFAQF